MRKTLVVAAVLLGSVQAFAQAYITVGTGYSVAMPDAVLGTNTIQTPTSMTKTNNYGSFGTGINFKVNAGYFFTENLGIDLGFTLLNGPAQTLETYLYEAGRINVKSSATASAIGFAPSLVYKMDNGLYGRLGLATKIGGQTDVEIYNQSPRDANTYTLTTARAVVNGKLPIGITSALGYSYAINDNLSLFGEIEILSISVKRDKLTYNEFDTSVYLNNGTVAMAGAYTIDNLPPGYTKVTLFDDTFNNAPGTGLTSVSNYSSVGLSVGVKYAF